MARTPPKVRPPKAPAAPGRAGRIARSALRWTVRLPALFLAITVLQVLAVRFVDPPFTLTMASRAVEAALGDADEVWPRYAPVRLADLPEAVPRAFVASEDARFFLHDGFDWEAICAAVEHNAAGGRLRGGSTLTQQVAKNVFLWQQRSWLRKGLEAWYTLLLELLVPKERILELYLSVAETGPLTFGVDAGARRHFGRPASALTADQAGRIAGILPDPRRRSVRGEVAAARAAWIAQNPAPFPSDPSYPRIRAAFRAAQPSPGECLGLARAK